MVALMCFLLIAGCVQTNSPVEKVAPSFFITPQNTPGEPDIIKQPVADTEILPRYRAGDVIDFSQNIDKVPHIIILDYNNKTGQYQYDIIFRNDNKTWGYRLYPEPRWDSRVSVEKNEPFLITHINITDIETRFQSREIFEKTR